MIKLENIEVTGWEHAIRGMRNPMNSWDKSDSKYVCDVDMENCCDIRIFKVGNDDLVLMKRLRNAGTDHRKFMRMITVYVDITAPLYWWKEFDTYKVGTVANSCSTMHKIADKEFICDDFSIEKIYPMSVKSGYSPNDVINITIEVLNHLRNKYIETKNKVFWDAIIQLLPSSYNQKRTVMMNYEVLTNIYKSRYNHKIYEWRELCKWIEELPYSELITGELD